MVTILELLSTLHLHSTTLVDSNGQIGTQRERLPGRQRCTYVRYLLPPYCPYAPNTGNSPLISTGCVCDGNGELGIHHDGTNLQCRVPLIAAFPSLRAFGVHGNDYSGRRGQRKMQVSWGCWGGSAGVA